MRYIDLTCSECDKSFSKPKNEYDRRIRNGVEKFYCSLSCSGSSSNRISPRSFAVDRALSGRGKVWAPDDLSPFRWYVRVIKARTKRSSNKKGPSDLTENFLAELWNHQNGICPITGWKLILPYDSTKWSDENPFSPMSASLDRINNSIGYVQGNVRFIAVMANFARNKFNDEEVIKFAKAVTNHNKS